MAETTELSKIKLNKANPRTISDIKFKKLVDSLLVLPKMLELRPLVVEPDGTVLGGNMRLRALKSIKDMDELELERRLQGLRDFQKLDKERQSALKDWWIAWIDNPKHPVPTKSSADLTDEEKRSFVIKDNASFGEWDWEALANGWDVDDLVAWGLDLPEDWNGDLPAEESPEDLKEDDFDESEDKVETRCKPGDIWQLGRHRLMCGDSTSWDDVQKLTDGQEMDLLVTDPPYNVNYEGSDGKKIENDNMGAQQFIDFLNKAFECSFNALKPGGAFYVWHADSNGVIFRNCMEQQGLPTKQVIIWVKNSFTLGRQDYQWRHEPCLYGWKPGAAHYFCEKRNISTVHEEEIDINKLKKDEMRALLEQLLGDSTPTTVIHHDKPSKNADHPTMKPIKLIGELIWNSSRPTWKVLDLFGGSGSTLIAAEQLNRDCCIMEYDPHYADVIIARWEKFTEQTAVRLVAGATQDDGEDNAGTNQEE